MVLTTSRINSFSEKLIEFTAKAASGIKFDRNKLAVIVGPTLLPTVNEVIDLSLIHI
mgnify:CR=1 FL=1